MPDAQPQPRRGAPLWETVAIFAAIVSLWPAYVLPALQRKPAELVWLIVCYALLAVMLFVFVLRMVVFHRLVREQQEARRRAAEEGTEGRQRLPWEPDP
ncbi:hypothetical protein HQ576_04140 [bacterium]|nr:hypothetical protein [bacterium]